MIRRVNAIYFSPAGHTKLVTIQIAARLAELLPAPAGDLAVPRHFIDFTLPENRRKPLRFAEDELVVFGCPTYAGRVPNKILPFMQELFSAENTPAIAVVTFGNRNYDSSLAELQQTLLADGFRVFAAGAFPCRHVFSDKLAAGRPDESDLRTIAHFAGAAFEKLSEAAEDCAPKRYAKGAGKRLPTRKEKGLTPPVIRQGEPVGPYYVPKGEDSSPAVFLKAKPKTDETKCDRCGLCAKSCPMGSIDAADVTQTPGICIKCHACIRKCPRGARYFDDPAFLSHVAMLEKNFSARKEAEVFL